MTRRIWVISQKESPILTLPPVESQCHVTTASRCLILTFRCRKSLAGLYYFINNYYPVYHTVNYYQNSLFLASMHFFIFLVSLSPLRRLLLQHRRLLLKTQLTSWGWTVTLNLQPCPQLRPLLHNTEIREEWKLLLATATSSMTYLHLLLVRLEQCRKTCSSVGQPVEPHQTKNVKAEASHMLTALFWDFLGCT